MYIKKIKDLGAIKLSIAAIVILILLFLAKDAVIFYTFNPTGRYEHDILMYSTSSCPYCAKLRQCFADSKISYIEKNVKENILASFEHEALGGRGVPVVLFNQDIVYGYNIKKLNAILTKSNQKLTCHESG